MFLWLFVLFVKEKLQNNENWDKGGFLTKIVF